MDDDSLPVSPEVVRRLMTTAVAATIILTAIAFWLSYAHLHDVADGHGLANVRAWAWPAAVDLFIIIGETMILVANLLRRTDAWAIFVTVVGSVGSIALNVAGVGSHAAGLNYVVAAVPPSGALLAFGLLMRQLKAFLTRRKDAEPSTTTATEQPPAADGATDGTSSPVDGAVVEPTIPDATEGPRTDDGSSPPVDASVGRSDDRKTAVPSTPRRQKAPRSGARKKAPRRSLDEWVPLAGPIFHAEFTRLRRQPTANEFAKAIEAAGHCSVSDTTAKTIRSEILDRADVPALAEEGR